MSTNSNSTNNAGDWQPVPSGEFGVMSPDGMFYTPLIGQYTKIGQPVYFPNGGGGGGNPPPFCPPPPPFHVDNNSVTTGKITLTGQGKVLDEEAITWAVAILEKLEFIEQSPNSSYWLKRLMAMCPDGYRSPEKSMITIMDYLNADGSSF